MDGGPHATASIANLPSFVPVSGIVPRGNKADVFMTMIGYDYDPDHAQAWHRVREQEGVAP